MVFGEDLKKKEERQEDEGGRGEKEGDKKSAHPTNQTRPC
jgi:hypothetical protein